MQLLNYCTKVNSKVSSTYGMLHQNSSICLIRPQVPLIYSTLLFCGSGQIIGSYKYLVQTLQSLVHHTISCILTFSNSTLIIYVPKTMGNYSSFSISFTTTKMCIKSLVMRDHNVLVVQGSAIFFYSFCNIWDIKLSVPMSSIMLLKFKFNAIIKYYT